MSPRSRARVIVAVVYAAFALYAAGQAVGPLVWRSAAPGALLGAQAVIALAAAAAAGGAWAGRAWAPGAAVLHSALTAGMLLSLERWLGLGPEVRAGLGVAAGTTAAAGASLAWYLHRLLRSPASLRSCGATSAAPSRSGGTKSTPVRANQARMPWCVEDPRPCADRHDDGRTL